MSTRLLSPPLACGVLPAYCDDRHAEATYATCGPVSGHDRLKHYSSLPNLIGRHPLVECLREKRDLATQQLDLKHQMGLAPSIPDPEQLAKLYHRDIACVVAGGPVSPDYNAERMDWTTRALNHQGELGARG